MEDNKQTEEISTREKTGVVFMAVGFVSLVAGIAFISPPLAAIVGGALLLAGGVVIDRLA